MSESSALSPSLARARPPHPFLYFLLFLPFGATAGFITVTIGSLAGKAGLPDSVVAGLVVANTLPHTFKVFWAPLVDTIWTGRGWYVTSNLISSAAIISIGFIPINAGTVGVISTIVFINGLSTTFIGMCTESLMARLTPPEQRGLAGGWSQAGNLGGATVGGLGLLLAEHTPYPWIPAVAVGGLLLCCSLALSFVQEPPPPEPRPRFLKKMADLMQDLYTLFIDPKRGGKLPSKWLVVFPPVFLYAVSGAGILSIALCLMPIGSGGAQNLFAVMAPDWHAPAWLVSIVNGLASGVAAIVGSLVGGLLSTRLDKRWAYALSGIILGLVAFAMALAPRHSITYASGVMLYSFALGMCYATFTAFVLDIIGHTGGATKYNIFASMANWPISIMAFVDGSVADSHGRTAMLWVDGLAGIAGAVVLMLIVALLRWRRLDPLASPADVAAFPPAEPTPPKPRDR